MMLSMGAREALEHAGDHLLGLQDKVDDLLISISQARKSIDRGDINTAYQILLNEENSND